MKVRLVYFTLVGFGVSSFAIPDLNAQGNPFLRPGSKAPSKPVIRKPAPPPPPPIPHNPNLEFRGYLKLQGEWHFALFDKTKNRGEWLQEGETMSDGGREIEGFDLKKEELLLKGGVRLALKESEKRTLALPGGGGKPPPIKPTPAKIPPPRR